MSTTPLDTLKAKETPTSSDFQEKRATEVAARTPASVLKSVATKPNIANLATNVAGLKVEISNLKANVANLKANVADLKANVADLKVGITRLETRLMIELVVASSIIIAILSFIFRN